MDKSLWKHIHVGVIKHREHSFHVKYIFIGNWNAKVGSQETPGLTGRFGLGEQNEAGQRLAVLQMLSSNNIRDKSTHGHHQMGSTEIRLIILFAAKDEEALYSHQKQDQELTVVQIMSSLLPNSDLN